MELTIADLEQLQTNLTQAHLDYQLELVDGKIIVMGLSDYLSDEVISRLIIFLGSWVMQHNLGRVTGASAGFRLPDGNFLRGPDVCFVSAERLRQSPRTFAKIVPDLMVEVKSSTDRIPPLEEKIQKFLQLGSRVGILIDPDKKTATIYRPAGASIVLGKSDILAVPELLPGWELPISQLWPPVFED